MLPVPQTVLRRLQGLCEWMVWHKEILSGEGFFNPSYEQPLYIRNLADLLDDNTAEAHKRPWFFGGAVISVA